MPAPCAEERAPLISSFSDRRLPLTTRFTRSCYSENDDATMPTARIENAEYPIGHVAGDIRQHYDVQMRDELTFDEDMPARFMRFKA